MAGELTIKGQKAKRGERMTRGKGWRLATTMGKKRVFVGSLLETIIVGKSGLPFSAFPNKETDMFRKLFYSCHLRASLTILLALTMTGLFTAELHSQTIALTNPRFSDYFDYTLYGTGDSGLMKLRLVNKTEETWVVKIEVGTKLEPTKGNPQAMVVTEEVNIEIDKHETHTAELKVNCLDITKRPPASTDRLWRVVRSPRLATFLGCINKAISDAAAEDSEHAAEVEQMRPFLRQFGLWAARGATRQQWIDFWIHYQGVAKSEAEQLVDGLSPIVDAIKAECGSLSARRLAALSMHTS